MKVHRVAILWDTCIASDHYVFIISIVLLQGLGKDRSELNLFPYSWRSSMLGTVVSWSVKLGDFHPNSLLLCYVVNPIILRFFRLIVLTIKSLLLHIIRQILRLISWVHDPSFLFENLSWIICIKSIFHICRLNRSIKILNVFLESLKLLQGWFLESFTAPYIRRLFLQCHLESSLRFKPWEVSLHLLFLLLFWFHIFVVICLLLDEVLIEVNSHLLRRLIVLTTSIEESGLLLQGNVVLRAR
jgi:hypothetical protein